MMKPILILIQLVLIGLMSCKGQKDVKASNCCNDDCVKVNVDTSYGLSNEGVIYIHFNDGFNDTLTVYLNGMMRDKSFYKTKFSTSFTGKSIKWDYSSIKKKKMLNLKVVESSGSYCLDINLKRGYKNVNLYRLSGKWQITYSNAKRHVYE